MGASWEHLVVGTDGSPTAGRAVARAVALAADLQARLSVVYVGDPEVGDPVLAAVAQAHPGAALDLHVLRGDPADAMLAFAEQEGCGLVVVGSKGMTGAARFLLGSVPNKVSHRAGCDVLIVHTTGPG